MLPKSVSERHMGEQGGSLQPQYSSRTHGCFFQVLVELPDQGQTRLLQGQRSAEGQT